MYETLYRKYRPQKFSEVTGQEVIKTILQGELASERVAHAYLFSGPRGIGKTSIARILTKAVNCLNRKAGESEPCASCKLCLAISEGKCFDAIEIDAASHTGIDNVRENIIENVRFHPTQAKFKVFIIDEAHMLSKGAFNALLKTLEEPPPQVIFILATTEIYKVPLTIISRSEHFQFRKIAAEDLVRRIAEIAELEKVKLPASVAENIARFASGSLRDALTALGQLIIIAGDDGAISEEEAALVIPRGNREAVVQFWQLLSAQNTPELLRLINNLAAEGADLEKFYDDCVNLGRELIFASVKAPGANISGNGEPDDLCPITAILDLASIVKFTESLILKKQLARFAPMPQLPLELAVVEFCNSRSGSNYRSETSRETQREINRENTPIITRHEAPQPNPPVPRLSIGVPRTRIGAGGVDAGQVRTDADFTRTNADFTRTNAENIVQAESGTKTEPMNRQNMPLISLEQLKSRWVDFLNKMGEDSPSLSLLLRLSEPVELVGNTVKIGVKYRFHKERVNEPKTRFIVEKFLREIFGVPLRAEAVVPPKEDNEKKIAPSEVLAVGQGALLQSVLREFGGRVVE